MISINPIMNNKLYFKNQTQPNFVTKDKTMPVGIKADSYSLSFGSGFIPRDLVWAIVDVAENAPAGSAAYNRFVELMTKLGQHIPHHRDCIIKGTVPAYKQVPVENVSQIHIKTSVHSSQITTELFEGLIDNNKKIATIGWSDNSRAVDYWIGYDDQNIPYQYWRRGMDQVHEITSDKDIIELDTQLKRKLSQQW